MKIFSHILVFGLLMQQHLSLFRDVIVLLWDEPVGGSFGHAEGELFRLSFVRQSSLAGCVSNKSIVDTNVDGIALLAY
jgi:hypothetical protein